MSDLFDPIPREELRFYRLIDEREATLEPDAGKYTLACGHVLVVSPAYSEQIQYLPCPLCLSEWERRQ